MQQGVQMLRQLRFPLLDGCLDEVQVQCTHVVAAKDHLREGIVPLYGVQQRREGVFITFLTPPKEIDQAEEVLGKAVVLQRRLLLWQGVPHGDGPLRIGVVDPLQQILAEHIEKIRTRVLVLQFRELRHDPRHGGVCIVHGIDLFAAKPLPMFGEIP